MQSCTAAPIYIFGFQDHFEIFISSHINGSYVVRYLASIKNLFNQILAGEVFKIAEERLLKPAT